MELKRAWIAMCILYVLAFNTGAFAGSVEKQGRGDMTTTNDSTEKELTFKVEGMSCTGCSKSIHNALMDTEGVSESDVSYEEGRAVVRFDPEKISAEGIIERIEELGFEAEKVGSKKE